MEGTGGYDCEFTEKPPDAFPQTHCPICLLILREPQQVSCCGYSYCEACIGHVRRKRRCPSCNEATYTVFPDKRLKRSLYNFRVHCCHQRDGCEWAGQLRELDKHLNLRPSRTERLEGCWFADVRCVYCYSAFQRHRCADHESDDCPKRPYACQHCSYGATFEEITGNHLPVCPLSPVACPNCQVVLRLREMENHVDQDCPLTHISCDFHTVGCPVQLARKDIPSHIRCDLDQHTALLKEYIATHPGENMSRYTPLLVKSITMYRDLKHEREQRDEWKQAQNLFLILAIPVAGLAIAGDTGLAIVLWILLATAAIAKLTNITQYLSTSTKSSTVRLTVTEFEKHKNAGDVWYTPSFYTHYRGYRMCLAVHANGYGRGRGTHMSVSAYLMPGAFDDELQWPFRGKVTVTLCNQVSGKENSGHTDSIDFANTSDPDSVHRVTSGSRAATGWGLSKFIAHSELYYNAESQSQYLKNSCLLFQVKFSDIPVHECS